MRLKFLFHRGNLEILPLDCDCGCEETEHRNISVEDINGISTEVEYSLY